MTRVAIWLQIGYHTLSRGIDNAVDYATTPQASHLTGLSIHKLREWTSRRALIPADVPPKSKGSPARYTWQTILILRLAVTLRDRFHLELQAHKTLFESLKTGLRHTSLSGLSGKTLALYGEDRWNLIEGTRRDQLADEMVLIRLNPHLRVLAASFAFPNTFATPSQIELFPVQAAIADRADHARLPRREPVPGAATADRRVLA
jgi:hypothetical protein